MPWRKNYSYTDLEHTPKHGEIIESSYLLNENNKEPKSTWTHILEALVLVATIGGGAYVLLFLFQNGNRHPTKQEPSGKPHAPVGATSASSMTSDDAECVNNPACLALDLKGVCCPTDHGIQLECCKET